MKIENFYYVFIHLFTVVYPVIRSVDTRINIYKRLPEIFKALVPVAIIFVSWDMYFSYKMVWSFNWNYVIGIKIVNLPIEEVIFFIAQPFACIFIHEVLKYFVVKDIMKPFSKWISVSIILTCFYFIFNYSDRIYTLSVTLFLAILIFLFQFILRSEFLSRFYLTFIVSVFPFLIVNGFLTSLPIIIYNSVDHAGLYLGTIPVEDLFYGLILLLLDIGLYEWFLKRKNQ